MRWIVRFSRTVFLAAVTLATIVACASAPEAGPASQNDVYLGAGTGATLGQAIAAAKMDAVQKAVVDLIGPAAEQQQRARLDEVLYGTDNPNAYVFNDTMETLQRDGSLADENLRYEIRIRVNLVAIETTLQANGIGRNASAGSTGSQGDGGAQAAAGADPGTTAQQRPEAQPQPAQPMPEIEYQEVTDAERRYIARFVDTMTYMVYFTDQAAEGVSGASGEGADGDFLMRSSITQANSYLVENGHIAVDAAQVERLKEDQRLVYEEQVGQELSLLQWIARRLNADVYIEVDARIDGRTSGVNYYATADVGLSMFDTSTGQILGSITRRSQEAFSRTSVADAAGNAVQSTVYQAMPAVVEMSQRQMERTLTRGIRYEVTLQRPPDARTLSRFRNSIRDDVREIQTVNQSQAEVLFEVFFVGSTDDLVDLIFAVSDRVAGFEEIDLVLSRGRSLTFDVGL